MSNTIKHKRGSGSDPSASDLVVGELAIRTDTGKIFLKKDNGTVAEVSGGGGLSDGDKGDIVVSNSGDTLTIDNGVISTAKIADDAVTFDKIAHIPTSRIVGRSTSGTGTLEAMTASTLRTLINVEDGATADQTASEIVSLLSDQNITTTGTLDSNTLTINSNTPILSFNEGDGNPDYRIAVDAGRFRVQDTTNGNATRFQINTDGHFDFFQNCDFSSGIDVTGNISCSGTVDGVDIAARNTLFGGLTSSSGVLTNGVTATTQSAGNNTTRIATTSFVSTAIANLADSAPSTLNTLNELAAALGDDANFSTTVTNSIATKLPLAGGTLTGNLELSSTYPSLTWTDTNHNSDYRITNNDGQLIIYDITNSAHRLNINADGHVDILGNLDVGAGIDVTGDISVTGEINSSGQFKVNANNNGDNFVFENDIHNAILQLLATGSNKNSQIFFGDSSDDDVGRIDYDHGNNSLSFMTNTSTRMTIDGSGNISVTGTVDGRDIATDGAKLDGIEASATADQTAAEIRTLVESASDSNVFTDADHSKLNGIEASATADQTKSDIDALGIAATTAATLATARNIAGVSFDGSANISLNNNAITNGAGYIDGSALNAANLSSGTIPDARFPATLPAASAANLTSIPAANITGTLPAIDGSNLTGIGSGGHYVCHLKSNTTTAVGSSAAVINFNQESNTDNSKFSHSSGAITVLSTGWYTVKGSVVYQSSATSRRNTIKTALTKNGSAVSSADTYTYIQPQIEPIIIGHVNSDGTKIKGEGFSVTRNSTGDYTITFSTAMPDANYVVNGQVQEGTNRDDIKIHVRDGSQSTTEFRVYIYEGDNGTSADVLQDRDFYFTVNDVKSSWGRYGSATVDTTVYLSANDVLRITTNTVDEAGTTTIVGSSSEFIVTGLQLSTDSTNADTLDGVQASGFLRSDATDTATGALTFSRELTFSNDDDGIFLYGGGRFYKKAGTGMMVRLHNNSDQLQVENNSGTVLGTFWHSGNDGAGTGLDADLLDGQEGSYYRNAGNINAGTISDDRLPATISSDITGSAATLTNARSIAGTSFNGSASIDISYTNLTNKLSVGDGGLTQNNFTNTLKSKLDGIAASATNVTNNNQLTNGAGYITATLTEEQVEDFVGGMLTGNTETGITVTYQDSDGTIDFVVGTLNQDTTGSSASCTGNAATATKLAATKTIAGVAFDGSANISLNNNAITNGAGYITSADGGNAATLDGIDSASFLRSDADDSFTGTITGTSDGTNPVIQLNGAGPNIIRFDRNTGDTSDSIDLVYRTSPNTLAFERVSDAQVMFSVDADNQQAIFAGNLDVGAGLDVTGNITVSGTVDGRDLAADGSKLDGIEASATADQTASEILTLIKTVDGAGSGLDADTLDGVSSASFLRSDTADTITATLTARTIIPQSGNTYNLGSTSARWNNLYVNDMHFSNEGKTNDVDGSWGDWTLQEGETDIFMINNRSGKKFKIAMIPV